MQLRKAVFIISILSVSLSLSACRRSSDEVWEDSKSAGRHMSRGLRTIGGKNGASRSVQNRAEFMPMEDVTYVENSAPATEAEFVPLADQMNSNEVMMADFVSPQPAETPGDPGSSIPGIAAFRDPSMNSTWAAIFHNITFDYNSNLVKGQRNLETIHSIADYMKSNPSIYVFVEGHTDERGPEAYNLSLGSRRSNAVRNMLLQEGVNQDHVFTISYGKEKPLFHDHNEDAWGQNRRAEFKIYQR